MTPISWLRYRALWVSLFAISFAWVEASVVVYLRDLYYPEGFTFPLKPIDTSRLGIELVREFSTLVMLAAVGFIAGTSRWTRFAFFALAFGVWDIFFYLWLKVSIDWPASILDWDILFLIPIPWIGPVIAPVVVSIILVIAAIVILSVERTRPFAPPLSSWIAASLASILVLATFMWDTDAGLRGAMPRPYAYEFYWIAIALYAYGVFVGWRHNAPRSTTM